MTTTHALPRVYLIRHGETAWSLSGQHTSRTDIPLTPAGEVQARHLGERLAGLHFSTVFSSPRKRARQTGELAGIAGSVHIEEDLREWEYGDYEGQTSAEIRAARPGWNLFEDGAPGGETPVQVFARAENFVRRLHGLHGNVAVLSHGHFLRVLAAAWVKFPVAHAQRLGLGTASLGILSYEHHDQDDPAIVLWNDTGANPPANRK